MQSRLEEIFALWDALSDAGKDKTDLALKLLMERICVWLDAQDAFWVGAVRVMKCPARTRKRDALSGWRIRSVQPLNPEYHDTRHYRKVVKAEDHGELELGETSIRLAAGAGRFRAYTLRSGDLVDVETFQQTAHYDFYYRRSDIRDRIWVVAPVNDDAESYFCFDRIGEQPPFDTDDMDLAAFALRGIKWFHHALMLSHGLGLCDEPVTPSERNIIQELLAGGTEREIADRMNLSQGTVHQYANRIYKKFGVRGRTEFTSLWLSGQPG